RETYRLWARVPCPLLQLRQRAVQIGPDRTRHIELSPRRATRPARPGHSRKLAICPQPGERRGCTVADLVATLDRAFDVERMDLAGSSGRLALVRPPGAAAMAPGVEEVVGRLHGHRRGCRCLAVR